LRSLRTLADRLIGLSASIGALGLFFEVAVILADVVGRAMGRPLYGSQDMITMAMVIVVFGAMALCDRGGGHIAVDLLQRSYPPALNRAIDILAAALGGVIFLALAYAVYDVMALNQRFGISSRTNLLGLPIDLFRGALVGFALLTACAMFLRSAELLLSGRDIRTEDGPRA
jgi:TRAP-type C4-dicarboxylate transport system permease small subunit